MLSSTYNSDYDKQWNNDNCKGRPVGKTLTTDPMLHFYINSGYFKIDASIWFSTNPDGCLLDYEFSFND